MEKVQKLILVFLVIALVCSVLTIVLVNYFPDYQLAGKIPSGPSGQGANIKLIVEPPAINVSSG